MQAELTSMGGEKAIGITFTDKPVTAFGGLALFVAFAERLGLAQTLEAALPFPVTSPNATPPHQILLASSPACSPGPAGSPNSRCSVPMSRSASSSASGVSRAPRRSPGSSGASARRR